MEWSSFWLLLLQIFIAMVVLVIPTTLFVYFLSAGWAVGALSGGLMKMMEVLRAVRLGMEARRSPER